MNKNMRACAEMPEGRQLVALGAKSESGDDFEIPKIEDCLK